MKKQYQEYHRFKLSKESARCARCGKHVDELGEFEYTNNLPEYFYGGFKLVEKQRPLVYHDVFDELCKGLIEDIRTLGNTDEFWEYYSAKEVIYVLTWNKLREYYLSDFECKDCFKEQGAFKHFDPKIMDAVNKQVVQATTDVWHGGFWDYKLKTNIYIPKKRHCQ